MILQEKNFDKLRKAIKQCKLENKVPKVLIEDDELARKLLEHEKNIVFIPMLKNRKDKLYQRNSGMNHILVELAKKNGISIGIFLDEIIQANRNEKGKIISRVKQNIALCKKKKISMQWISEKNQHHRNKQELQALGVVLGMNTEIAKNSAY